MEERVARLEERDKAQNHRLQKIELDVALILENQQAMRTELHGARLAGRLFLGTALCVGTLIGTLAALWSAIGAR